MRGRELFKKTKIILNIFTKIMGIFPIFIRMFIWNCSSIFGNRVSVAIRYILLKTMALKIGDNIYIGKYVIIKNPKRISIGNNVSIHDYSYIDGTGGLEIGNDVSIAHSCSILTTNHQWVDSTRTIKDNIGIHGKVIIGNDVWIGCGVRILSNVTINNRSVVAAGAVVNKNVEENSLVGGVPIKKIKSI